MLLNQVRSETFGSGADGEFIFGDLRMGLPEDVLERYRGKVQVVFVDPPYPAQGMPAGYTQRIGSRGWRGDRAFTLTYPVDRAEMEDDETFFALMKSALRTAYELLSPTGVIFVHTDSRTSYVLRRQLDEVFGSGHFLNEIIWHYKSGGRAKNFFSRKHDNILFYRKGLHHFFDVAPLGTPRGRSRRNHMRKEFDENGRAFFSITSGGKKYIYYEDQPLFPDDVWDDIAALQQKDPERTGYDTQEPEALIERMLTVTSRPGDIVCDLFAGSGTAEAVAYRLGCPFLGMDCNVFSLLTVKRRLWAMGAGMTVRVGRGGDTIPDPGNALSFTAKVRNGNWHVSLNRYELSGMEGFAAEENLVPELPLVDGWGIGHINANSEFSVEQMAMRQVGKPYVPLEMVMPVSEDPSLRPALWVADVRGSVTVHPIEEH